MSNFWAGKTVCVTGGGGFLGFHLVCQLVERGARVRALCLPPRKEHPLWNMPVVDRCFGDLLDPAVVRAAVADCAVVFHTAGVVAVWGPALQRMYRVHVEGTRNVLAAAPPGARIVHTSSVVAVGAGQGEVFNECTPFNLGGVKVDYVHAKRAAEEEACAAAAKGQDVVITNPCYLVGPVDHEGSVMGRFCQRFWKGRMPLAPPGGFNLVDVRDVARGHLQAAERGQSGRRYILGNENHSIRDFMLLLAEAAGMNLRALPQLPAWLLATIAAVEECRALWTKREPYPSFQHVQLNRFCFYYACERARAELGYTARPLSQTLRETYRWYQERDQVSVRSRWNRWWLRPSQAA